LKNIRDILFEILRASVFGTDAREKFREAKFSQEELEALYQLASAHDLAHIVGFALEKNESIKAHPIAKKIERIYLLSVFRRERQNYEYARIQAEFEKEKIPYLPLKGILLCAKYPEAFLRTSTDIDVLVKEEDMPRAETLLRERLSYKKEDIPAFHDVSLHSPGGIHLELHFTIKEQMESMDRVLGAVWDNAHPLREGSSEYRMTEEYFCFHQIAHAAYHFIRGGCGIRPFLDLYLLQKEKSFDESKLSVLLKEAKLDSFWSAAAELAEVWFGKGKHSEITRQMESYLLGGGLFGTIENRVAMGQSQRKGKVRYAFRRIFMPYQSLSRYYPGLKKRPILYPLYQFRRWLRILFGKNRDFAVQELMQNADLDQTKVDRASLLRKKLGLE